MMIKPTDASHFLLELGIGEAYTEVCDGHSDGALEPNDTAKIKERQWCSEYSEAELRDEEYIG